MTRLIDIIQEGAFASRAFTIITDKPRDMAKQISNRLARGVTLFPAIGGFSTQTKEVIYCVVYRHEAKRLKALVKEQDPNAFMIIHDVQDVSGEGFKRE